MAIAYGSSASAATSGTAVFSLTVALPSGFAAGDLVVATISGQFVNADVIAFPTPLVQMQRLNSGTSQTLVTAIGVAAGTETQFTFTVTTANARHFSVIVDRYTGNFDTTHLVASAIDNEGGVTDTTYPAPTVDAGANTNVLHACGWMTNHTTAFSYDNGVTERASVASTSTVRRAVSASKVQGFSGFTGVTTATSASALHVGGTAVAREAPGDTTPPAAPTGLGVTITMTGD